MLKSRSLPYPVPAVNTLTSPAAVRDVLLESAPGTEIVMEIVPDGKKITQAIENYLDFHPHPDHRRGGAFPSRRHPRKR